MRALHPALTPTTTRRIWPAARVPTAPARWRTRFASALVALSGIVPPLLVASAARAYCREAPDPSGGAMASIACADSGQTPPAGLAWIDGCVGYSLQRGGSVRFDLEAASVAADAAFQAWAAVTCPGGGHPNLRAVNMGPVACSAVEYNQYGANQNVIVFRDESWPHDDPSNALGLTTVHFDERTGAIVDADMEINTAQFPIVVGASAPPPDGSAPAVELATVLTHEVGHYLGLAHSLDPGAMMYRFYAPNAVIAPDDIEGICAIYPPLLEAAGSPIACNPLPKSGFSSACGSDMADASTLPSRLDGEGAPSSAASSCAVSPRGVGHRTFFPVVFAALWMLGRTRVRNRCGLRRRLHTAVL